MNRLLTILLLAATTAYGQINNPPTSVNITDATATGRAVLTATNAAAAATAIGLGTTNYVGFYGLEILGAELQINGASIDSVEFGGKLDFEERRFSDGVSTVFEYSTNSFAVTPNATFETNVTISGNATLNGVGNIAPHQTASSADSLMTRDLSDLRLFGKLAMVELMNPNMGVVYATNGAAGTPNVNGFDITTSTNSASSAFYSGATALKQTLSGMAANTSWQGRVVVGWTINRYSTNNEVRMQLGRDSGGPRAHGPLINRGIGIRVSANNMFFETHDGTTHFETTNAVPVVFGFGATDVLWAVAQSGVVRFYRGESTLLATVTNNVPTTAESENDAWSMSISNTSTVSSGLRVRPGVGFILQQ